MGLINSVDRITRQLDENNKLLSLKEEKRIENERLLKDIEETCYFTIIEYYEEDKQNDLTLKKNEIISNIADELLKKTEIKKIEILKDDNWKFVNKEVPMYNIQDILEFEKIIRQIYVKEHMKIKKDYKETNNIIEDNYITILYNRLDEIMQLHDNKYELFNQISRSINRIGIINELSNNDYDKQLFTNLYPKVLRQIKQNYMYEIRYSKEKYKPKKVNNTQQQRITYNSYRPIKRTRTNIPKGGLICLGIGAILKGITKGIK